MHNHKFPYVHRGFCLCPLPLYYFSFQHKVYRKNLQELQCYITNSIKDKQKKRGTTLKKRQTMNMIKPSKNSNQNRMSYILNSTIKTSEAQLFHKVFAVVPPLACVCFHGGIPTKRTFFQTLQIKASLLSRLERIETRKSHNNINPNMLLVGKLDSFFTSNSPLHCYIDTRSQKKNVSVDH